MPSSAVIFDFDGTLTKPYLDFDAIRKEIGLGPGPILEALGHLDQAAREAAEAVVERHELEAARHVGLREDAEEVVARLAREGWGVAILTRNARRNVEIVMQRFGLVVDAIHTREDGAVKPSPDGVFALCAKLGVAAERSWVVGDYLFDIQAGRAAGAKTVLLVDGGARPGYANQADFVVPRLSDLYPILGL